MRNLLERPITTAEIIAVLRKARDRATQEHEPRIGNLDAVCFEAAITRLAALPEWEVRRTDDNGREFVVQYGLSEQDALNLYDLLTRRGHKQVYVFRQMESDIKHG